MKKECDQVLGYDVNHKCWEKESLAVRNLQFRTTWLGIFNPLKWYIGTVFAKIIKAAKRSLNLKNSLNY